LVVSRGLEAGSKILVSLGGGEATMAEQGGSDPHMIGVVHGDRRGGAVPEEMNVYPLAEGLFGPLRDGDTDRVGCLWRKAIADPQSVAAITLAHEEGSISS
jgi:hypothetical protein